jgi:hypothetical protein
MGYEYPVNQYRGAEWYKGISDYTSKTSKGRFAKGWVSFSRGISLGGYKKGGSSTADLLEPELGR